MMIICDPGTLAHALHVAARQTKAVEWFGVSGEAAGFLDRLGNLRTRHRRVPSDVAFRVGNQASWLNEFSARWRVTGSREMQQGFRFADLQSAVGAVTSIFWWLLPDVPHAILFPEKPQCVVLPTQTMEVIGVASWPYPIVRIPLKHHGHLWLTPSEPHASEIALANDALAVLDDARSSSPAKRWSEGEYRHVILPVFVGYRDQRVEWLKGLRFRSESGSVYAIGPFLQHVRAVFYLQELPRLPKIPKLEKAPTTLRLDRHLMAFVTPPENQVLPYCAMSISEEDWRQSW